MSARAATPPSIAPMSPIPPMLARVADALPSGPGFLFEPKWDGFRVIVFRTDDAVLLQSRDLKPLNRYFPELEAALLERLPAGCVLDGEVVVATDAGLDFDALQQRIHPAASRVARLAAETPASFVAFDLLAVDGESIRELPQSERRGRLEQLLARVRAPLHLTPMTRDRRQAVRWLARFEGAGLDGVMAKPAAAPYEPGKRAMFKIKHVRSADCVVAGLRWYKDRTDAVGSLLLGLYDDAGTLHHVGVASSFTMAMREALRAELEPLRRGAMASHPWRQWRDAAPAAEGAQRLPGARSRWSAGKDLDWVALRPERACEVRYDHLQGLRFRHAAVFLRWRLDKPARDCRYDQLEVAAPYELAKVFGA